MFFLRRETDWWFNLLHKSSFGECGDLSSLVSLRRKASAVKRHVLDADSLRAFLEDKPGAATIEDLLWKAVQSQQRVYVSVLSWNYLLATVWHCKGESVAREKMKQLEQLPLDIVDVTEAEAAGAAKLAATSGVDYFNCIAAATAQQRRATLVTTNKELSKFGDAVKIFFAD